VATDRSRSDRSPELRLLRPALELALDVARAGLAEEPPVLPPPGLRRVLSFARPSGTSWATVRRVVDADEAFRARVAEAADHEVIGRAPWIWLTRPDGWEADLDDLVQQASTSSAGRESRSEEVAALRRKLAGAEQAARRHEEAAEAARVAEAAARARLSEQQPRIDELEQRVTELSGALDAALAERREAVRNLKALEADLASTRSELREVEGARREAEAVLDVLRESTVEAAPVVEEAPPPTPGAPESPELDLDALRAAVRDAGAAAAALGSALRAAAAALEPAIDVDDDPAGTADAAPAGSWEASGRLPRLPRRRVRRPVRLPGGVFEESTVAADHLLRLPEVIVVVDGYNVAKTAWTDVSLEEERRRLVQLLERAHLRTKADFLVVFDGEGPADGAPGQAQSRTVRVRFSPAGVTADDVVRDLVDELPLGRPVVVVSSDREVVDGARARGANVIGSRQLLDAVR